MSDFFGILSTLYKKDKANVIDDIGMCIAMTRTLSKDPDNAQALKKAVPFMFYMQPKEYFFLLYCLIPKKNYVPKLFKTEKKEEENEILEKIKRIFKWSNKDLVRNRFILEKLVLSNEEYWKGELGIK